MSSERSEVPFEWATSHSTRLIFSVSDFRFWRQGEVTNGSFGASKFAESLFG